MENSALYLTALAENGGNPLTTISYFFLKKIIENWQNSYRI